MNKKLIIGLVGFGNRRGSGTVNPIDFEEFTGGYQGYGRQFMTGWASPDILKERNERDDISAIVNPGENTRLKGQK